MTKLEMAHEYAKIIIEKILCGDIDSLQPHEIASDAFAWADAMQAEAVKRGTVQHTRSGHTVTTYERPAVLQDEWQPDWSVAPVWANYWCMQAHGGWCYWTESQPTKKWDQFGIIKNELAPSFGYQGSWVNSLRKRP